jgi:hypothetical protein
MRTGPRVLWVLLCLLAGAPCAFLALEFIRIPLAALVLTAIIVVGRRRGTLAFLTSPCSGNKMPGRTLVLRRPRRARHGAVGSRPLVVATRQAIRAGNILTGYVYFSRCGNAGGDLSRRRPGEG